jgi:serine/threonine-protein kinase
MSRSSCPYCQHAIEWLGEAAATCPGCRRPVLAYQPGGADLEGWLPGQMGGCRLLEAAGFRAGGQVYKAEDASGKGLVAVRIFPGFGRLNADARSEADRELSQLVGVEHAALAGVKSQGTEAGLRYLVREWVVGTPLNEAFRSQRGSDRTLPFNQVLPVFQQLVGALMALHERRIPHGRIRPDQVLVGENNAVKLLEPAVLPTAEDRDTYLAPERRDSPRPTGRSDVYELGMVLYEQLTGFLPGSVPRRPSIVNATVPDWFDKLILRMLERDPQARPVDLAAAAGESTGLSEAAMNRLAGALGGAIVGGAVGALSTYFWNQGLLWIGLVCGLLPGMVAGYLMQPAQPAPTRSTEQPLERPTSGSSQGSLSSRDEGITQRGN